MKRLKPTVPKAPSIRFEKQIAAENGGGLVAGVDEAGRGPLAGPVVAAAVILSWETPRPAGLNDSKKLSPAQRERLFHQIQKRALAWGIGIATAQEVDLINILEATRLAARRALQQMQVQPDLIVTDCLELPWEKRPVFPVVKGDAIAACVSAASILAKVTRDRMMDDYAEEFPEYNWRGNKGYPTPDHYAALHEHGPTTLHRMTFSGVGFFDQQPRWTSTGLRLRGRLEEVRGGGDSLLALAHEIELLSPRLPPLEAQELRAAVTQFQSQELR